MKKFQNSDRRRRGGGAVQASLNHCPSTYEHLDISRMIIAESSLPSHSTRTDNREPINPFLTLH